MRHICFCTRQIRSTYECNQNGPQTRRKRYNKNVNQFVSIFSATESVLRSNSLGWLPLSIACSINSANNVFSTLQKTGGTRYSDTRYSDTRYSDMCYYFFFFFSFFPAIYRVRVRVRVSRVSRVSRVGACRNSALYPTVPAKNIQHRQAISLITAMYDRFTPYSGNNSQR